MEDVLLHHLKDWRTCTEVLHTLREDQVRHLLDYELKNRKRASIITRLHQRFCVLRTSRERVELLEQAEAL